jgi:RNA polymerase sigma-70 factor (ECF subfamily)
MNEWEGTPVAPAKPNNDLLSRIAAGDRGAEKEFVTRHYRGILALVRRHCRPNDPAVEDLAQEVVTSVLQRLRANAIRDEKALPAYIQIVIVRLTAAEYRGRRDELASAKQSAPDPVDVRDPGHALDAARRRKIVSEMISQLPTARDREVLRRFYLQEQSRVEVCQSLEIDESHFHRVVFRARQRLRQLLEAAGVRSGAGETPTASATPFNMTRAYTSGGNDD